MLHVQMYKTNQNNKCLQKYQIIQGFQLVLIMISLQCSVTKHTHFFNGTVYFGNAHRNMAFSIDGALLFSIFCKLHLPSVCFILFQFILSSHLMTQFIKLNSYVASYVLTPFVTARGSCLSNLGTLLFCFFTH